MYKFLLILLLGWAINTNAQNNFFYKQTKGTVYVFQNSVITHVAPSSGAAIDDTLALATPLNILMQVPYSQSVAGYEVPWLKVTYKKNGFTKVSFVLANSVSLSYAESGDNIFLVVWEGKDTVAPKENVNKAYSLQDIFSVQWIIKNRLVSKQPVSLPVDFAIGSVAITVNKLQLKNAVAQFDVIYNKVGEEMINVHQAFVACSNQSLVKLPGSLNFKNEELATETIQYSKSSQFIVTTKSTIVQKRYYKWKDCEYSLIKTVTR